MRAKSLTTQYKGVDWRAIQDALEDAGALPHREVLVSLKRRDSMETVLESPTL